MKLIYLYTYTFVTDLFPHVLEDYYFIGLIGGNVEIWQEYGFHQGVYSRDEKRPIPTVRTKANHHSNWPTKEAPRRSWACLGPTLGRPPPFHRLSRRLSTSRFLMPWT
jgi:hypothetical protein